MKQFTNVFERIDLIQEAEGFFVAREVGNYLYLLDIPSGFSDPDEPEEIIASCQDWFVHMTYKNYPCTELAELIAGEYWPDTRNLADREKLARGLTARITEARQQFREYLPYISRML